MDGNLAQAGAQAVAQVAAQQAAQADQMMDFGMGVVKAIFWIFAVLTLANRLSDIRDELRAIRTGEKLKKV